MDYFFKGPPFGDNDPLFENFISFSIAHFANRKLIVIRMIELNSLGMKKYVFRKFSF